MNSFLGLLIVAICSAESKKEKQKFYKCGKRKTAEVNFGVMFVNRIVIDQKNDYMREYRN